MHKGYLIDNKYRILDILGKGGMSTVYLAENIKLGTLWAVKEIKKAPDSTADLLAEANILKRLNHPALPKIIDIVENGESIYIIVDYIEGKPLDSLLEELECLAEEVALGWAKQLCEVLIYLHGIRPNPIIYRDMKPSNIIVCKDGSIKLIDFGIAREYKEDSDGDTVYIGTRGYASPEQYGFGQTSATSDIYSLGITLFHIVTGRNPNYVAGEIKPVRNYNNKLSKEIEALISKCIRSSPEERFQTAKELLTEIEAIIYQANKKRNPWTNSNYSYSVPEDYKKIVGFVGDKSAGTTLLIAAVSEIFSAGNKNVTIIDMTRNRKLNSIFGWAHGYDHKEMGDCPSNSIINLMNGKPEPLKLDKYRFLYTSDDYVPIERSRYIDMLESVRSSSDIILIAMDFETDREIIRYLDLLYVVKDMDMHSIRITSEYLKNLKSFNINLSKIRFIINKFIKTSIKAKSIIDTITLHVNNDEYTKTGFFMDRRPIYYTVPFDLENYRLIVESINQVEFSCSSFSQSFKKNIFEIAESIYPLKDSVRKASKFRNIFSILKENEGNGF